MNNISLKIRGLPKNTYVFLDDKLIKHKKDSFANKIFNCQTEKAQISLKVYKVQDLTLKHWWLNEIVYFIFSLFGLLDFRGKGNFYEICYEAMLPLCENTEIQLNFDRKGEKAIVVSKSNIEIEEKENKKEINGVAKKRFKWVVAAKIFAWIVLAVVICLCAIL